MRKTNPTLTSSAASTFIGWDGQAEASLSAISVYRGTQRKFEISGTQAGTTWTAGNGAVIHRNSSDDAWVMADARH